MRPIQPCKDCGANFQPGARNAVGVCESCTRAARLIKELETLLAPREGAVYERGPRTGQTIVAHRFSSGAARRHEANLTRMASRLRRQVDPGDLEPAPKVDLDLWRSVKAEMVEALRPFADTELGSALFERFQRLTP